jgi:hypothetical protein
MNYDNLLEKAMNELPEFKEEFYRQIERDSIDTESGNHTVFSLVFVPLFCDSIKHNQPETTTKMANFIETMERSNDPYVQEVSSFTILEELSDLYSDEVLLPFLKSETQKSLYNIRQYIPNNN